MSISIFRSLIGGLLARYWPLLAALFIVAFLVFLPDIAYAQGVCRDAKIARLLSPECLQQGSPSYWVIVIWRLSLSIVNVAAVLFLIIIALATILHWNIDTYGFKKALPTMVIGIVLANFSMLIVRAMVDVANILTVTFAGDARAVGEGIAAAIFGGVISPAAGLIGYPIVWIFGGALSILFALIAALFVVLIPALLFLVLYFLLFIRITIIMVFAAIAPLAFATLALPGLRGLFSRWFGTIVNWIFMAPAVFLLLRIASEVGTFAAFDNANPGTFVSTMLPFTIALGAVVMAIMVPFKMGGAIMAAWGGVGAFITGTNKAGWLRNTVTPFVQAAVNVKQRMSLNSPLGRLRTYGEELAGITEEQLKTQKEMNIEELRARNERIRLMRAEIELTKRQTELVREITQQNLDFDHPEIARAQEAASRAATNAKESREKFRSDINIEEYARMLPRLNEQISGLAPDSPERRRLEYERSRIMRRLDEEMKTTARVVAEDATPESHTSDYFEALNDPNRTFSRNFGTASVTISGNDIRAFMRGDFDELGRDPATGYIDRETAQLKSSAIEQDLLTIKEWATKGWNTPQFFDSVEQASRLAVSVFGLTNPATGAQWTLFRTVGSLDPVALERYRARTDPQQYRQVYQEASRELQKLNVRPDFARRRTGATMGWANRPAGHGPR